VYAVANEQIELPENNAPQAHKNNSANSTGAIVFMIKGSTSHANNAYLCFVKMFPFHSMDATRVFFIE